MQALKALVIFMGLLILVGMGVVAYGIAVKFGGVTGENDGAIAPMTEMPEAPAVWTDDLRVKIPAGAQVAETIVAEGRIVVRLVMPDDTQRYLVFDLGTGRQIGAIDLAPRGGGQ